MKNKKSSSDESYCDGSNKGYCGPKEYESLFNKGINPRCGKLISECNEGMAHVHC